ncbi:MAG TPA: hypothetical protein PKK00_05505 [Bacteroidales bacterium]|nr:hypothetical protein [Bacteroidales bacterium]HPS17565.1 hypothetical protein [Bacteroidales bacterium]
MSGTAAAAIAIKIKKIVARFRELNATTPDNAVSIESAGFHKSRIFSRLINRGVLVETNPDKFYLDELAYLKQRHRRLIILLSLLIIVTVILLFTNNFK